MSINRTLLFALLITVSSCKVNKPVVTNTGKAFIPDGKLWAALWHQRAAEYKALCFQAYNVAKWRLDIALQSNYSKPLAIITDIDETVLDNSPNTVSQGLAGKEYEPEAWYKWTSLASADTIAGAASFFKYAASKPVTIFYISNRDEKERQSTLTNLQKFGLPNADTGHLLLKQNTSGKDARRQEVLKNYEVVLLIGDNLSDFSNIFDKQTEEPRLSATKLVSGNFGNRFIILPNVQYGDWEGALYQYNPQISPKEKEKIFKSSLKGQ